MITGIITACIFIILVDQAKADYHVHTWGCNACAEGGSEALLYYLRKRNKNWRFMHKILAYCLAGCMVIHIGLGIGSFFVY